MCVNTQENVEKIDCPETFGQDCSLTNEDNGRYVVWLHPKATETVGYQLAKANNIHHRFNMDKKEAGKEWYCGFMSRHPDLIE